MQVEPYKITKSINMKYVLLLGLVFTYCSANGQNMDSDSTSNVNMTIVDSLKLKYEEAILRINEEEKQATSHHDSICKSIEAQLKEGRDIKTSKRLSVKKRHDLEQQLRVEKQVIEVKKRLYGISKTSRQHELEEKLKAIEN